MHVCHHRLLPLPLQEMVKAGLLLALFGGVRKHAGTSGGSLPVRGDIHCLMVGDPGLGKSQLLQAAAGAAPRGVYICGNTSSAAGLTVSIVREGGEFAFDAGALVLADRGVCAIDEFDKCTGEHQALLGAMEQQEVSVAKAGLVASLPARTTILAAANPVDGSYNRAKVGAGAACCAFCCSCSLPPLRQLGGGSRAKPLHALHTGQHCPSEHLLPLDPLLGLLLGGRFLLLFKD